MSRSWTRLSQFLGFTTRNRTISRRRAATRLQLESLEDRVVPTIVFEPHFGPETLYNRGGPVLGDTPVYLLYWGSYWTTSAGAASETQITSAINNELKSPIYNRVGSNYGAGPVYLWGTQNGGGPVTWNADETGDPSNGFTDSQLQNVVTSAINDQSSPILGPSSIESQDGGHAPIYFVITPPNIASTNGPGEFAYHSNVYANLYDGNNQDVLYGWSSNGLDPYYNTQDFITQAVSHELGEVITDPNANTGPQGYQVSSGAAYPYGYFVNEIGDFEPSPQPTGTPNYYAGYTYRLNGSLVQALWDESAQGFTVSDGTSQNFYIDPQYQSTSTYPYYAYVGNLLVIDGDQLGSGYNDTITINTNSNGNLIVTLNGETATFDPGQITGIDVYAGGGYNTINVLGTPSGVTTDIIDQGNDTVTIGNNASSSGNGSGHMSSIQGAVDVSGPGSVYLYLDDSGDSAGQSAYLYDGAIYYGGAAPIDYTPTSSSTGGVIYLAVYGGSGGNPFNVENTSNFYYDTYLDTGSGNDSVNVYATQGVLYNYNPGGSDYTNVGQGYMNSINGLVDVYGSGSTNLTLDNSLTSTGQTVNLYDGEVTGLSSAPIEWSPTSSSTGGVTQLAVYGNSGGNTFNVNNTSDFYYSTFLSTGTGSDTVKVYATKGALDDYNPGGTDYTIVGLGNMGSINGFVNAFGPGEIQLDLNDSNDTTARTVSMNDGSVTGLGGGTGTIYWTPTATLSGGVTTLFVYGGSGGNTFNVHNTSNFYYWTTLNTGTGNDTVNVYATQSGLEDYNTGGSDTTNVGLGSVANINGWVSVDPYVNSPNVLIVDDHLDNTSRTAALSASNSTEALLTGLGNAGAISYTDFVASVTIDGSSKGSTYNIQNTYQSALPSTPVTINGGGGNDIFNLGSNSLNVIQGALTLNGGGGSNTLNANDSGSATGQSYTLSKTTLMRSGIATISYASLSAINVTGSGSDTLSLLNPVPTVATTFNGGSGTNTLVGANVANAWTISGANSGKLDSVTFSNVQDLVGGTGVDVFKFSSTSAKVARINGGGAPAHQGDWLNYASLPSSTVTVNLATGSASNVNSGAAGAVSNIQDVIGSATGTNNLTGDAQGNIFIGGSGLNTIVGGSGNSLLIGGSGHGSITGGSGTDILIAGTTTYNATTTAGQDSLMAILAELQSADTFAQKVSDIIHGNKSGGGSDLNGTNKLTWGVSGATVKASTGKFTLSGDTSASSNPDWFFSASSSTVTDFNDDGVKDEHNNNAIGTF